METLGLAKCLSYISLLKKRIAEYVCPFMSHGFLSLIKYIDIFFEIVFMKEVDFYSFTCIHCRCVRLIIFYAAYNVGKSVVKYFK